MGIEPLPMNYGCIQLYLTNQYQYSPTLQLTFIGLETMCISINLLLLYTSKKGSKQYRKVVIQVISSYNGYNHGYYIINTGLEVSFSKSI